MSTVNGMMMQTTLNMPKSGYTLMGPKHLVEEARRKVQDNSVLCRCGQVPMKDLEQEKWLGDMLSYIFKPSVMVTIKDREHKIRRASLRLSIS